MYFVHPPADAKGKRERKEWAHLSNSSLVKRLTSVCSFLEGQEFPAVIQHEMWSSTRRSARAQANTVMRVELVQQANADVARTSRSVRTVGPQVPGRPVP